MASSIILCVVTIDVSSRGFKFEVGHSPSATKRHRKPDKRDKTPPPAMPSIHTRPNSPYFAAAFVDATGRRRLVSTKTADRSAALAEAERLQREADTLAGRKTPPAAVPLADVPEIMERFVRLTQRARAGSLTAEDAQAMVNAVLVASGQDPLRRETPREFFASYLANKTVTRATATAKRYSAMSARFLAAIGPKADQRLHNITARDVQAFRDSEKTAGLNPASANLSLVFVRSVLEQARREGVIGSNVAEAVDTLPAESAERRAFTRDEINRLLAVASPDWQTAINLAVYAGYRLSDATGLRWEQFDAKRGVLVHRPKKEARHRAAKKRETVCPTALVEWLSARQGIGAAPITPTLYERPTNQQNGLSAEFNKLLDAAKIPRVFTSKDEGARRVADVGFHALRHTAASWQADAGISEDTRRETLGQSSRVHKAYVHREAASVRAKLDTMPRITPAATA